MSESEAAKSDVSSAPPKTIMLRGFFHRAADGKYEGICLTLNLAVRGNSLSDVENKMCELTVAYLEDATASGHWDDLVPRHAPLYYYLIFNYYKFLSHFKAFSDLKIFIQSAPSVPCSPAHA